MLKTEEIAKEYSPEEMEQVYQKFDHLCASIDELMDDKDRSDIKKALEVALIAHSDQRRKSGEAYIFHPLEVARICAEEIELGPTAIIAALLHDVVEDSDISSEEIQKIFGDKIASIVDGLTKIKGLYNVSSVQAENFKKVLSTLVEDVRVVLIKMADRLHNLRTAGAMPRDKQLKIASETAFIYAPLAHRLGLYNIKTEYEDQCMKLRDRDTYAEIAKKLDETKKSRNEYIRQFITPLKEKISEYGFPFRIFGRPKSIYSIANKIKTKKVPFDEIYDLFAIRIIVDVPPEKEKSVCWQVYSVVTDVHQPIPERLKDWVTTPKANGYESLHTTVIGPQGRFVEVQIRSERMDEIAERGFAAHWKYKGMKKMNVYDVWLKSVRDILDSPDASSTMEFVSDFKTHLWSEEVFVYTPKGDLKILPKGATALDFAFAIHSDVGYTCTGVKVNNRLVPMGYKLSHGDQVTVLTSKNQKPNESWLKSVITGKARSKIRQSLKEEKRRRGQLGKEWLERKLSHLKVPFEENIDTLVDHYGFNSRADLYFDIATDKIQININKDFNVENQRLVLISEEKPKQEAPTPSARKNRKKKKQPKIFINGEPGNIYEYSLASCCNPVRGDSIFGYTSLKSGLKIHRFNCPNATHLLANYASRVVNVSWAEEVDTSFTVELLITGHDQGPGMVEKISNRISSKLGINIRSFKIEGLEGYFEGRVGIIVENTNQLNMVMNELKKIEGISNINRIK